MVSRDCIRLEASLSVSSFVQSIDSHSLVGLGFVLLLQAPCVNFELNFSYRALYFAIRAPEDVGICVAVA